MTVNDRRRRRHGAASRDGDEVMSESALLIGQLFNGISVASILLLAALGLALSFGLMRVINMAHGEMLMMGGYLTYVIAEVVPHGPGYLVGLVVAFVGTALFGALLEVTLIRRLYGTAVRHAARDLGCQPDHAAGGAQHLRTDRR